MGEYPHPAARDPAGLCDPAVEIRPIHRIDAEQHPDRRERAHHLGQTETHLDTTGELVVTGLGKPAPFVAGSPMTEAATAPTSPVSTAAELGPAAPSVVCGYDDELEPSLKALLAVKRNLLGYCRGGDNQGMFVVLVPLNPHRGHDYWDVSFSATNEETISGDFFVMDFAQDDAMTYLGELDVEWAPSESMMQAAQSAMFSGPEVETDAVEIGAQATRPFGRFDGSRGLDRFVRHLVDNQPEISVWRDYARPAPLKDLATRHEVRAVVDELSAALRTYGYTLAVVPTTAGLVLDAADPWSEFRSQTE